MAYNKYKFRKYNPIYPKLFQREKRRLSKLFPVHTKIEHMGSTSVPGLAGKGIIDIAIAVNKSKLNYYLSKLEQSGYVYKPKSLDNQRKFLERKIMFKGKERRIHVHLTYDTSEIWESFVAVRAYLRSSKDAQKEYMKIKKQALKQKEKSYHKYKHNFIEYLSKQGEKLKIEKQ